jgi:hypothetical protein
VPETITQRLVWRYGKRRKRRLDMPITSEGRSDARLAS